VPNTAAHKFRLGSIKKQFTAAAVMQLQEQGKLSVTNPACKFVDGCPEAWKPVIVHHLLTHTSGIPSYTNMPGFREPKMRRVPLSPLEIALLSKDMALQFPPGEKMVYNNTGYVLLGHVIEKASGEKYAAYLKKHIFNPLDMNDTGYDETRTILPSRAAGYSRGPDGLLNADFLDMSLPHAAGSLYSTLRLLVGRLHRERAHQRVSMSALAFSADGSRPCGHDPAHVRLISIAYCRRTGFDSYAVTSPWAVAVSSQRSVAIECEGAIEPTSGDKPYPHRFRRSSLCTLDGHRCAT
jgi:CubicO group peptidase (beta-lactamase class C family)